MCVKCLSTQHTLFECPKTDVSCFICRVAHAQAFCPLKFPFRPVVAPAADVDIYDPDFFMKHFCQPQQVEDAEQEEQDEDEDDLDFDHVQVLLNQQKCKEPSCSELISSKVREKKSTRIHEGIGVVYEDESPQIKKSSNQFKALNHNQCFASFESFFEAPTTKKGLNQESLSSRLNNKTPLKLSFEQKAHTEKQSQKPSCSRLPSFNALSSTTVLPVTKKETRNLLMSLKLKVVTPKKGLSTALAFLDS
jgi:hypothetical protein